MTLDAEGVALPLDDTPRSTGKVNVSPVVDPTPSALSGYCSDCGQQLHDSRRKLCRRCRVARDRQKDLGRKR